MDKRKIGIFSNELRILLNNQKIAEVINRINQAELSVLTGIELFVCVFAYRWL